MYLWKVKYTYDRPNRHRRDRIITVISIFYENTQICVHRCVDSSDKLGAAV
jgi:hypothetical protein